MRKLMMVVAAVSGLALTVGCKRNEVQEERRDLAEAQQEAQKEMAEIRQETREEQTELRQEEQEEVAEAQRDVTEEQQELAEAERERAEDLREDNAAGPLAASATVQGRVRSSTGSSLVLIVPANNDAELKLKTNDKTRVMQNNRPVELDDFEEGTEVRASYVTDGEDLVARDVVIITPVPEK
jgi:dynactin complex subunit